MTSQQEAHFRHLPFRAKLEFLVQIHEAHDLSDALRVFNRRRGNLRAAGASRRREAADRRTALADAIAARYAD
jgi:hypothetical protein